VFSLSNFRFVTFFLLMFIEVLDCCQA